MAGKSTQVETGSSPKSARVTLQFVESPQQLRCVITSPPRLSIYPFWGAWIAGWGYFAKYNFSYKWSYLSAFEQVWLVCFIGLGVSMVLLGLYGVLELSFGRLVLTLTPEEVLVQTEIGKWPAVGFRRRSQDVTGLTYGFVWEKFAGPGGTRGIWFRKRTMRLVMGQKKKDFAMDLDQEKAHQIIERFLLFGAQHGLGWSRLYEFDEAR